MPSLVQLHKVNKVKIYTFEIFAAINVIHSTLVTTSVEHGSM